MSHVFAPEFSSPAGVRELANGVVMIPDRREVVVKILSPGTDSVRTMGREGEGPGEFLQPGAIFPLKGDSTAVFDEHNHSRRFLIFDDRHEFSHFESGVADLASGPIGVDTATTGAWVLETYMPSRRVPHPGADYRRVDSLAVITFDRALGVIDTIGNGFGGGESLSTRTGGVPTSTPVVPPGGAVACPDGWIAMVHQRPYRVDWVSETGDEILGSPFAPEGPVAQDVAYHGYRDLVCAPDGRLLVPRAPPDPENVTSLRYDVIDRTGQLVAFFTVADNEELIGSGRRGLYVAAEDSVGLKRIHVLDWPM